MTVSSRGPLLIACIIALVILTGRIWFTRTPPFFPKSPEQFLKGEELLEVVTEAQSRLSSNPEDLKALIELGVAHFQQGPEHYVEAANALEKARDLGALDTRIFYYLGICYEGLGLSHEYVLLEYQRYLRNCPSDVETRVRVANLLFQDKRYEQAITQYEQCRDALDKEDPVLLVNLGLAYQANKQREEAIATLERARRLSKGQLPKEVWTHLGQLYSEKSEWDKALSCFQAEERQNPQYAPLYEGLANAYEAKGLISEALAAWKKLSDLDPKNKLAKKKVNTLKASS